MSQELFVLYAEDDENDVFFMKRAFAKLKGKALLQVVENGREAVDYLSSSSAFRGEDAPRTPDLLVVDIKMPIMSGLEVLAWVRNQPELKTLPLLMFTSSAQDADVERCRAKGANAYLVKPSNAEDLRSMMEKVFPLCSKRGADLGRLELEGNQL